MGYLKNQRIYLLICLAVFASGLLMRNSVIANMMTILYFEMLLIALCLFSLEPNSGMLERLRNHLLVSCLAGLLLVVVLIYY